MDMTVVPSSTTGALPLAGWMGSPAMPAPYWLGHYGGAEHASIDANTMLCADRACESSAKYLHVGPLFIIFVCVTMHAYNWVVMRIVVVVMVSP